VKKNTGGKEPFTEEKIPALQGCEGEGQTEGSKKFESCKEENAKKET